MTVCVAIVVHDCIVFAADSASSLIATNDAGASEIINVYSHGDKVFNLVKGLPICAMTCGMGNIGAASIATLTKELRRRLSCQDMPDWYVDPAGYTIDEIATKARRFFFEERFSAIDPPPPAPHSFEFWIGGYGADFSGGHQVSKVTIVNGSCGGPELQLPNECGWLAGGQANALTRLLLGFDPQMFQVLLNAGMSRESAQAVVDVVRENCPAPVVMPNMPIRDAIDLADFLVETTKRFVRFLPGADIVGGDTDIAVVTKYEGFKWIRRKHFYPAGLNPLETDHA